MSTKNSFVSLASQVEKLMNNSISILTKLTEVVESVNNQIDVPYSDSSNIEKTASFPSVGYLQSEIKRLNTEFRNLSSVDQRGSVIQPSNNEYAKIIRVDLNREPNTIPELSTVSTYHAEKNWFFDSLLNPILRVRIDLNGKVENNVRKVISRRYIIKFQVDENGNYTPVGQTALDTFNESFKNRSDITVTELEIWLQNTPGVAPDERGYIINYDEQEFEIEANKLQYEGYFTILGVDEDTVNRKQFFQFDTLDYYDIETKEKRQLQINDELIINTDFSATKYRVIEINNEASEIRLRLEIIEGFEPIPVGIVGGMKFYSDVIKNKTVDVSIGFDEYNVVFLKAINTETFLVGRDWSKGVAYYTNDLTLLSEDNLNDNGKSMLDFYVNSIRDYGILLRDLVERQIPRSVGIKPDAPVLDVNNFRVRQNNKYLTETTSVAQQRKKHQQVRELRSKIEETSKLIQEKRKELFGKSFRNAKDRTDVENQINKLQETAQSDTELLNTTVNDILALNQNSASILPTYIVEGFWQMPIAKDNGKTRKQEVIAFNVEYKYANVDGKEDENETFKVINEDGTETNAVFSPWKQYTSKIRKRVFNVSTQKFEWQNENLSSIDEPNINSIAIDLKPTQQVTIRVKSISEAGFPDSLLESEWSEEVTISFPEELLQGRNPEEQFQKNAELEDLRNRLKSDLDRNGLTQHLNGSVTFENKYFPHITKDLGYTSSDGKIISLDEKIKMLESSDPVESTKEIVLVDPWSGYGGGFGNARYYKHEGRVYLSGVIRVDRGDKFNNLKDRFLKQEIRTNTTKNINESLANIGYLPEGYRPQSRIISPTLVADDSFGRIDILPNGLITIVVGSTSMISLDGISFRV